MTSQFRRSVLGLASALVLAGIGCGREVWAATILSKRLEIQIVSERQVRERTEIRVRLETKADLDAWSHYSVWLDANRHLQSFDAATISAGGLRRKAGRKSQDRMQHSGDAVASSQYFHVVEFPSLELGTVLEVAHEVEIEPYFPSSQMTLLGDERISDLTVEISGAARWRLDGPTEGLETTQTPSGVKVRGRDLEPREENELVAEGAAVEPVLRWSWSADHSWNQVGEWFGTLLADLPRDSLQVRRLAADLTHGEQSPRQRLEALVGYTRRKIRYVAVEIGIGGYRPSPPEAVLTRKWGDCKDKGLLLVSLLREAGIEAFPALVLLDSHRRIEPKFPSAAQFNHLIVAVPTDALVIEESDPVAGGYLFIDATQTRGDAGWLHPGVQNQDALVVTSTGGSLVRTPVRPQYETSRLTADFGVSSVGMAHGRIDLVLQGTYAAFLLDQIASQPARLTGEDVMARFERLFPGARLSNVTWQEISGVVPSVRMSAVIEIDGFVHKSASGASFRLPALRSTPTPSALGGIEHPVSYAARTREAHWRLELPSEWCLPPARQTGASNSVGSFSKTIDRDGDNVLTVEYRGRVEKSWFEGDELEAIRELAINEHRLLQRRIRLSCH